MLQTWEERHIASVEREAPDGERWRLIALPHVALTAVELWLVGVCGRANGSHIGLTVAHAEHRPDSREVPDND